MSNARILDCTLSDGGQPIGWTFFASEIEKAAYQLVKSGVDMIEMGILRDEHSDVNKTVFRGVQAANTIIPQSTQIFSLLMDETYPISPDSIEARSETSVDMIRVILSKDSLSTTEIYGKAIIDKGYMLGVLVDISCPYDEAGFKKAISASAGMGATIVTVYDKFGSYSVNELIEYCKWANEALPSKVVLGFHGQDARNELMAFVDGFLRLSAERNKILESSIYGMAIGAGLLKTEQIAEYLNQQSNDMRYSIRSLYTVYSEIIEPHFRKKPWNASPAYRLASSFNIDPQYIDYYTRDVRVPLEDLPAILSSIPEKLRYIFNAKAAREYFYKHAKTKLRLAVIIPTYNREKSIDYWLFREASHFFNKGIDIIIYDSSDNNKTEATVQNFQFDGYPNVYYKRYDGFYDGFSLDHKLVSAYQEYADAYDYLWICRDGLIIDIESCYETIRSCLLRHDDVIVVDASFRNDGIKKTVHYRNCQEFFRDHSSRIITLGTLIFSSNFAKSLILRNPIDQSNYSLWQMIAPLHFFASEEMKASFYIDEFFTYNPAGTLNSFWNKEGNAIKQWIECWIHVIRTLPSVYDDYKESALKIALYDFHPFCLKSLLRMRQNGGLNLTIALKHKNSFALVSDTALWKYYFAAIIPKTIAKLLISSKRGILLRTARKIYDHMKSE